MKAIKNDELIDILESRVEKQLSQTIEILQNLSESVLLKSSETKGWSIAQCLEHLNSYGYYYLPIIKTRLESQPDSAFVKPFRSSWLGNYFIGLMEPRINMRKMKAFKNHIPPLELNAYQVISEFIEQEEIMLKLLKMARNKDLNTAKIPISISKLIRLKLGDVFQFIVAHNERHLQQALRNL